MIEDFTRKGSFLNRDGKARSNSGSHSNKKLCFVSTDKNFLMELLIKLSDLKDCYFVKLTAEPKDGMYLGRCFFTSDQLVGEYWAKYKQPKHKWRPKKSVLSKHDQYTQLYFSLA